MKVVFSAELSLTLHYATATIVSQCEIRKLPQQWFALERTYRPSFRTSNIYVVYISDCSAVLCRARDAAHCL
jgi:hypothetical protein